MLHSSKIIGNSARRCHWSKAHHIDALRHDRHRHSDETTGRDTDFYVHGFLVFGFRILKYQIARAVRMTEVFIFGAPEISFPVPTLDENGI